MPSLSFLPGFPAADFLDCGPSIVAYGRDADAAADRLLALVEDAEAAFAGEVFAPDAGVRRAMELAAGATRPVVIADTQDNPGAGGRLGHDGDAARPPRQRGRRTRRSA